MTLDKSCQASGFLPGIEANDSTHLTGEAGKVLISTLPIIEPTKC